MVLYCKDIWRRCLAVKWMLMYSWRQSKAICEILAMLIKVVPVRSVASEAEAEHTNNDGYRHRCPSTTKSYKVLQSLLFSITLMGFMGWRDFSKPRCWVHVTKSTLYGFAVLLFLSSNVIRWCLIASVEDKFDIQYIFKLMVVTGSLEPPSHAFGIFHGISYDLDVYKTHHPWKKKPTFALVWCGCWSVWTQHSMGIWCLISIYPTMPCILLCRTTNPLKFWWWRSSNSLHKYICSWHGLHHQFFCSWASYQIRKIADCVHGPLIRYVKLRIAHAPGMPGSFSPQPRVSDPDMHQGAAGTCRDACRDR